LRGLCLSGILACVRCGAPLAPEASWEATGTRCVGCGTPAAVVRGIPRFVASDAYGSSFSYEWNRHSYTQLDTPYSNESERTFREKTGFHPEDVKDKLVLDVGCGMGRFTDVVSRWGGKVVGIDLSLAVEAAHANLGGRANVRILQADLFHLPFPPETFDIVYSIGVLHHTPDCEKAFRQLPKFLKPGGKIAVWVYGPMESWERFASVYRRFTVKMPPRLLHALCYVAIPWYYVCRLPLVGSRLHTLFPVSSHPKARWRVLDTFDWYSPRYQSKHAYPEVYRWFISEGLVDIELLDFPVTVRGRKPGL